jgi:CheY-specific phosphatase CheX
MKEALKTAMATSISEVLETMFFMTIDLNETVTPEIMLQDSGPPPFISRIGFHGKLSGFFLLIVPENILRAMTETFMGLETDAVTETHLRGTVQEAINMIAGNTFSNMDDQAVFDLDIPELIDLKTAAAVCPEETPEAHSLLVETFAGKLGLKVCFRSEPR